MRSPVARCKSLWLGCLLFALMFDPAAAGVSGEITGVRFYPENKRIVINAKGKVGRYLARVIGKPNRLVMDFEKTRLGSVPRKISVGKSDISEIRVGESESRARVVVDFRDRPVPAFKVRREQNRISVILGNSLAGLLPGSEMRVKIGKTDTKAKSSALTPKFVPAAAKGSNVLAPKAPEPVTNKTGRISPAGHRNTAGKRAASSQATTGVQTPAGARNNGSRKAGTKRLDTTEVKLAQRMDVGRPTSSQSMSGARARGRTTASTASVNIPASARSRANRRMVREVRPPVTPPTPDPRLLVQEITELRFFQVGHNSRLMVRGGDQLDYRMNKVTPTKLRLDLINAEIPKAHQKPLRTDLFSTSVEMIVPGSQTVFIQLKDAVPYQVQKKKGVLMLDFPPPRFKTAHSGDREGGGEAARIIEEEAIRKNIESRDRAIKRIQKELEQLQKQRLEILKSFQVTPDPEIFQKPVTMDFQGISLRNAFRLLAQQAGVNIIVDSGVGGTTTLSLFDVPLGQVMDTILNTNGLDRVMMGNVMRVGPKDAITQYKEERQKEFMQRIEQVDGRIESNRQRVSANQQEIERQLEELKALQEAPVDDTKAEEIGEAGCIEVEGERICFQYATVRLVYATPSQIVTTLDCLFRLNCPGARAAGRTATTVQSQEMSDLQQVQATGNMGRQQYSQYLADQGFTADSPGGRARMQRYDRVQASRERAAASAATAAGITQQAGAGGVQVYLPYGEDPKLARILAYGIIWANDADRMIFIKDTPERIAQMKKLIFTLDVPTPQVLIESRLVVADKSFGRGLGIQWGATNNQNGPISDNRTLYWGMSGASGQAASTITGVTTPAPGINSQYAVSLPTTLPGFGTGQGIGTAMQFGFLAGQYLTELDARLSIGENTNQSKTISRPKVQVADGQSAIISSGQRIPYQTVTVEGTQTQLVSAVLSLNVVPRIFADGRIRMNIQITDDSPVAGTSPVVINTRRSITTMTVKDGETAVIGGIIQNIDGWGRQGLPILMNVPLVGYLFGNKTDSKSLTELLVFITPSIIRRPPPAS